VIVVPAGAPAAASDARSTLAVSVTVVRPCVIQTDAADPHSTKVRVSCARNGSSSALHASGPQPDNLTPPARHVRVVAETMTGDASVRIVTVDF
jgi:hypothetical protein